jgi:hypothetical protein
MGPAGNTVVVTSALAAAAFFLPRPLAGVVFVDGLRGFLGFLVFLAGGISVAIGWGVSVRVKLEERDSDKALEGPFEVMGLFGDNKVSLDEEIERGLSGGKNVETPPFAGRAAVVGVSEGVPFVEGKQKV